MKAEPCLLCGEAHPVDEAIYTTVVLKTCPRVPRTGMLFVHPDRVVRVDHRDPDAEGTG